MGALRMFRTANIGGGVIIRWDSKKFTRKYHTPGSFLPFFGRQLKNNLDHK